MRRQLQDPWRGLILVWFGFSHAAPRYFPLAAEKKSLHSRQGGDFIVFFFTSKKGTCSVHFAAPFIYQEYIPRTLEADSATVHWPGAYYNFKILTVNRLSLRHSVLGAVRLLSPFETAMV